MQYVLLEQLQDFGLNPKEWTLSYIGKSSHHLRITSKKDHNIHLVGWAKQYQNGIYWKELTWI